MKSLAIRKVLATFVFLTLCVSGGLYAYQNYLRKVRLVFVGYPDVAWADFEKAAGQTPYAVHRLERAALANSDLESYTGVFIWGMGLNFDTPQAAALQRARDAGTKVIITAATNDGVKQQANVDAGQQADIGAYLEHGGEANFVGLLHYVARAWGGKEVAVPPLLKTPRSGYFYRDGALFENLEAFERHRSEYGPQLKADAPRVALIAAFLNPRQASDRVPLETLIGSLERRGLRVYPLFGREDTTRLLKEARPDLAIAFPHGRLAMGNELPPLLKELNVPMLTGLSLGSSVDDWMQDERGIEGGRLSQSVTMPELDGAIEPFALVSDELDERSLKVPQPIEERVERLAERAARWLELRRKTNAEKRVVVVYYKAPGLAALNAAGLEVVPSLWNMLRRLEQEGYDLGGELPDSPETLQELIRLKGRTLGQWAIGSYEQFLEEAEPEFVPAVQYSQWLRKSLSERRRQEILTHWGPVPGRSMTAQRNGQPCLVVSRIRLGNVVLMPQPTVGDEDANELQSIHGTDKAPPHFYLAAYLWARFGFQADAIVHFGTHGSLEFTRGKSAAMSADCWPDILIGDLPHIYPYIINNVGEALVAKRRSYAVIASHLTPPFTEASLYGDLLTLQDKLQEFSTSTDPDLSLESRRGITDLVRRLELHRDLGISLGDAEALLNDEQIEHLEDYIHELQGESVTDGLHVLGRPWTEEQVRSTVVSMLGEPDCAAIATLPRASSPADASPTAASPIGPSDERAVFVRGFVDEVLDGKATAESLGNLEELTKMVKKIHEHAEGLRQSTQAELDTIVHALRGGYVAPSSGGDPIINPESIPSGRNLYSFNAEAAPTEEAWRVGCRIADRMLAQHRAATGEWPQQVAVSLWGGEFVRDKGTTVAEVLHLLGVRPLRNSRGSVYDVEVIPSEELGRPRIDVLVQTSGQFRDAAASRIVLLDKAVQLVSSLDEETFPNFVRDGSREAEMALKKRGLSPQEARSLATARIFGAAGNQSYGTGIMGLVEKGDTWQNEQEVADRYVRNMGGVYREGSWGTYHEGVLESQLAGVDAVLHSRSSNTWGPLSLDHVYEFMGGITLSVRAKTGKDPQGYFSDLRSRDRAEATTAVAAIWEEARTTVWNPKFLQGLQREGASAAGTLSETVRNLYGWNVMQPNAIDETMWQETFAVLVEDKHALGLRQFFESKNPYALEDLTAVMLETIRKGYWHPSEDVVRQLIRVHTEVVADFGAACSYETCGNEQLQQFIAGQLAAPGSLVRPDVAAAYQDSLSKVLNSSQPLPDVTGIELEEDVERTAEPAVVVNSAQTVRLAGGVVLFFLGVLVAGSRSLGRRDGQTAMVSNR